MSDDSQPKEIDRCRHLTGAGQQCFDEVDAITVPAEDPSPTIAEFARTPVSLDPDAALASFDLYSDDADLKAEGVTDTPINPDLLAIMKARVAFEKADAKANGWTARQNRERSERRKGIGKDNYNTSRREEYGEQVIGATGKPPRPYGVPDSPEKQERRNTMKTASKNAKLAAMTPEEAEARKVEESRKRNERRQAARDRKKAEETAALKARTIFG